MDYPFLHPACVFGTACIAMGPSPHNLGPGTVDGGGGPLIGATYSIVGTIGQPDAGETLMGATYSLAGGLWSGGLEQACLADLADPYGVLNFSDVLAFLTAFGSELPSVDFADPPGVFNFSDVLVFLTEFGGGCQ